MVTNQEHYDYFLTAYPKDDAKAVGWADKDRQGKRFKILLEISNVTNSMILDVGCGLGTLLKHIPKNSRYTGIDIHEGMLKRARQNYPANNFYKCSLDHYMGKADWVICSGTFNIKVNNNIKQINESLDYMYNICRKGISINMLSSYAKKKYDQLYYFSPEYLLRHCLLKFKKVILRHDYSTQDFTLYIYK